MVILGWALAILFFITILFLGKELLTKFSYLADFQEGDGVFSTLIYHYCGGKKGGMRKIILKGTNSFKVLIAFDLEIPVLRYRGTDWYGYTESVPVGQSHVVVISTWMAKKPVDFFLIVKSLKNNDVQVVDDTEFQSLVPQITCPPHLYQRLGFYA